MDACEMHMHSRVYALPWCATPVSVSKQMNLESFVVSEITCKGY